MERKRVVRGVFQRLVDDHGEGGGDNMDVLTDVASTVYQEPLTYLKVRLKKMATTSIQSWRKLCDMLLHFNTKKTLPKNT